MKRREFLAASLLAAKPLAAAPVIDAAQLKQALRQAAPGDTILLRDGVWTDADLLIDAEGAAGKPITVRAQTPGRVILTGHSRLRIGGRHVVVDGLYFKDGVCTEPIISFRISPARLASECRVTGCAVVNYQATSKETDTKWISIYGNKNRLDHCYIAGKTNLGTTLVVWLREGDRIAEHRIDHNHFGPRPRLGMNGGETIRLGDSSTSMLSANSRVENNYFEKCSGEVEIISNKSCDNVYTANLFERCEGTLTLRSGNRCTVDGNYFLGYGERNTGGIRIIGEDHHVVHNYLSDLAGVSARAAISLMNGIPNSPPAGYFQVKHATISFNTILNCADPVEIGLPENNQATLAPQQSLFSWNVIVGKQGPLVRLLNSRADLKWEGNTFYGADTGLPGITSAKEEPVVKVPKIDRTSRGPDWFREPL